MVNREHVRRVYDYLSSTVVSRGTAATYEEICGMLDLNLNEAFHHIEQVLEPIFTACDAREDPLPPLTSLVVGAHTITKDGRHGMPGVGYFVAEAQSPNRRGRPHPDGIERFLPNSGLLSDEKDKLRFDFQDMVYAHQDSVWNHTDPWPDRLV